MAFANSGRRLAIAALCLVAPLAGFAAAASSPGLPGEPWATIELRPRVAIDRPSVSLGDIAFLTTRDLRLLRQLMALPIGAAPRAGTPVSLDRETIARWVEARSGLRSAEGDSPAQWPGLRWTGAGQTEVESASQYLAGEAVVAAAQAVLVRWLGTRSARAEVQPASGVRDLLLPAGAIALRVRPLADQPVPGRRMLVWVDAWVDGRFARTAAVSFDVGAWASLPVALADLGHGVALDPVVLHGALAKREVDVSTLKGKPGVFLDSADAGGQDDPVAAVTLGSGQRLRRPLQPGEVMTEAHLETMPAVVRGNWAQLKTRLGNVAVQGRAEVLQDGRPGQMVRIRMPGAHGEVTARVTGPGQVEVQP